MKPVVYIETTIVSYLTAWPSRDLIRAAQQRTTKEWWETQRTRFELVCSELVVIECSSGDSTAAAERLRAIEGLPLLEMTDAAGELAKSLVEGGAIPINASRDAAHVAICCIHKVPFLLTWNFRHLANAQMQHRIQTVCNSEGYEAPVICTPDALIEEDR